jgi:hypothetical protein
VRQSPLDGSSSKSTEVDRKLRLSRSAKRSFVDLELVVLSLSLSFEELKYEKQSNGQKVICKTIEQVESDMKKRRRRREREEGRDSSDGCEEIKQRALEGRTVRAD